GDGGGGGVGSGGGDGGGSGGEGALHAGVALRNALPARGARLDPRAMDRASGAAPPPMLSDYRQRPACVGGSTRGLGKVHRSPGAGRGGEDGVGPVLGFSGSKV